MTMVWGSALFLGNVMHRRVRPVEHRLTYRVFSLLVDLDELPGLGRALWLFAYNRPGLLSFHDRDHGPGDGSPLKPWIRSHLRDAGIDADGAVRILCFPRVLGYVFNPLSVWFCHRSDGALAAMLYEVNNTFAQRHFYLIPTDAPRAGTVHQRCAKAFYVSPFMDMATEYEFRIRPPGSSVSIGIRQTDAAGIVLYATLTARRAPLSDRALLKAYLLHPLMTFKVIAGIHWEAFRLWRKGMRPQPRPPAPERRISIVLPKAAQHG